MGSLERAWVLVVLMVAAAAGARLNADGPSHRELTRAAILSMTNFDFAAADRTRDELAKSFPGAPHVPFLDSYKYFWRYYLSGNEDGRTAQFWAAVRRLTAAASSARGSPDDRDPLLFLACARFFAAAIHREEGRAVAALFETATMSSAGAELRRHNPDLADGRFIAGAAAVFSPGGPAPTADLEQAAREGYYFAPIARFTLAQAAANRDKDCAEALPLLRQLTVDFPGNAVFHFRLAQCCQQAGLADQGLEAYRNAAASLHVDPPAVVLLCRSHFATGQILESQAVCSEAIAEYEQVLLWADESNASTARFIPLSHLHIARCLERAGRDDLALAHLDSVGGHGDAEVLRQARSLADAIRARKAVAR